MTVRGVDVPTGTQLIVATRNTHKVVELRAILTDAGVEASIASVADVLVDGAPIVDVVEDGASFTENALIKARATARQVGLPALADDSGLAVDILGGAPGIFSARWCGRHGDDQANLALLLAQLADVREEHRGARFVCAAALVLPDGREWTTTGELVGTLTRAPLGGGGFGYDPILRPLSEQRTCAQLTAAEKNAISHRGNAFRAMATIVRDVVGEGGTPGGADNVDTSSGQ